MFNSLSLRQRMFYALCAAGALLVISSCAQLYVSARLRSNFDLSRVTSEISNHALFADMMHDAIRSDVMKGRFAIKDANHNEAQSARDDLQEHGKNFIINLAKIEATSPYADIV